MPRRRRPEPPLPPRDGLGPARVRMPVHVEHPTVVSFLAALTGDEEGVRRRLAAGEIVLADGTPVGEGTPYRPGGTAYLYRDLPEEVPVPGELLVLLRDDDTGLLAVDKPPFLATTPRGGHVAQTALVRLRRALDLPELTPVHRLDRLTSGVLLLTTRAAARRPYQVLVQTGGLRKTYEALAPLPEGRDLPLLVHDRLVKTRGELQARVVPGPPNARTLVELLDVVEPGVGRYRLTPTTGQTHQLRVHLAGLGIPILGDPLYPVVSDVAPGDFSNPLQLLAAEVCLTDPLSGRERRITSARTLPIGPPTG
ncbi:pseudouridine synthase [Ornithinimicrobium flavum]|uniref:pseudouridine synthase n=1 Tax=Ornithinimicrobium flavum TaxID=1288636 RepID=UPI00106F6035|nr:pseudouridine synthase [Ornithinimicrobium flavum]